MSTLLSSPARLQNGGPLQTSPWSIHRLLRKSCEVTQALGAVLMTEVDGDEPQYKSSHLIAKSLAENIIDQFKNEPFSPGKPAFVTKIIGMGTVQCMAVSTMLNKSKGGMWTQARLAVILPAKHQLARHAVGLLEEVLHDIGLALDFYERHAAYFSRFDEQTGLKTCMVCENLHASTGEWLRWDEFLVRQMHASLSHTVCRTCAAHHYPECTGVKNEIRTPYPTHHAVFNQTQESNFIDVCAICENLSTSTGEWLGWEEYIIRIAGACFTHTICPACSSGSKVGYIKNRGGSELVDQGA